MSERMRICPECKRASSTYCQACGCGHQFNGSNDMYDAEATAIWQAANHAVTNNEFLL